MATKPRKTTSKLKNSSLEITLVATRLKKLAVEALIPSEETGKGRLQIVYKVDLLPTNEKNSYIIHFEIMGKGLSGTEEESNTAFTVNAAIDGVYVLSRELEKGELDKHQAYLASPLIPLLADMVETLLSKCGYPGVSLPRSFPNTPNISLPQ